MAATPAKAPSLDSTQKAAVLLMTIGEDSAAEVLKHMGPKEVQRIGIAMTTVKDLTKDMVNGVISEFMTTVNKQTALGVGVDDYVRNVLYSALGEDKATSVIDRILLGGNSQGLEALKWMAPKSIAELIQNEHPQIIAIILSYLESDMSAEVLTVFPEKVRSDLLLRIATLESVQPAAMKKLNDTLQEQLKGSSGAQTSTIGGVKAAADILNFIDSTSEAAIMEKVKEVDEDLGQEIQDLMFVFENLNGVDDRAMQTILREVSTDSLLLAMKAADDELKEKIYANMSKRAAEMLRDDLEAKGPVKLSEVETAQKEILSIARRLADEGQISLGGGSDEELI
ncbi:MAG: flagellar motor switch protein FliG [Proteobacteria bacterium]|nr:flagellar motor switch protein FliG [Pseudomonadota bacterium]NOG58938.1 flagellar motor switch protein FliG [Pseudomonadota bacterium]